VKESNDSIPTIKGMKSFMCNVDLIPEQILFRLT